MAISAGALHLRPHQPDDIDALVVACQDPDIQKWTSVPSPYTRADAEEFVLVTVPAGWTRGTDLNFLVLDSTTEDRLAAVGLHLARNDDPAIGEIGYWCAAPARGQGVMTRAVGVVCRWGFEALGLARIEWYAVVGNIASRRVAERVGFSVEGTLRSRLDIGDGARHDAWVGSLLRSDPVPA